MNRLSWGVALSILSLALSTSNPVWANDQWQFEITPYAWLAGIDGDVTLGEREVDVDVGFDDLVDAVDLAGSVLTVAQYNRWVFFGQFDYMGLDTDELDDAPSRARLETDALFGTAALGYQFQTFGPGYWVDVLGGARYARFEHDLTIGGFSSDDRSSDLVDGIFMLRPSFQLSSSWRFNPTMSIGAGDSDLTYELQPQFQFEIIPMVALRFGYRRLYYDVSKDNSGFDGALHGFIVGLGFVF